MADQVASLRKSLQRQAKLAAETVLRDGKWLPAVALLVSLAVASVLLFIHLPTAEIELDAAASELSFAMEGDGPLIPGMNVSDIRLSGSQTVELPDVSPLANPSPTSPTTVDRMRLTLGNATGGNITLSSFLVPKAAKVRLEATDAPNHYRVSLRAPSGASTAIHLSCRGDIGIVLFGRAPTKFRYHFDLPEAVISRSAPGQETSLDLSFPADGEIVLTPQLAVSDLSFRHVEQNLNRAGARYVSTVASGALFIESLNGLQRNLRSGDALRFASSTGEMRRLSFRAGSIHAQFQGTVKGMTIGAENAPLNLMPSLLEWLRARHGLYLMWGTALYLFGLLTGVWRWFRAPR